MEQAGLIAVYPGRRDGAACVTAPYSATRQRGASTRMTEPLSWGIDSGYIDARGQQQSVPPTTFELVSRLLGESPLGKSRRASVGTKVVVLRCDEQHQITFPECVGAVRWRLWEGQRRLVAGTSSTPDITLPADIPIGSYRLSLQFAEGMNQELLVLIAPQRAYQPELFAEGGRAWLLAVQLYAVRSRRNWGHGDLTDLSRLLEIARDAGAAGVGINPLHALAPGQSSAYSPSSRVFLNPLYIDIEAVPEFPGVQRCALAKEIARLRDLDMVDYEAVGAVKQKALRAAYMVFRTEGRRERKEQFECFRQRGGESLRRFAMFEVLRTRYSNPWPDWPTEWRSARDALSRTDKEALQAMEFPIFIQWIADEQLQGCATHARELRLPIGLYLDVAVGVDAGGADVWGACDMLTDNLSIGAPPDIYNPCGQNWGLTSFHPQALIESDFASFREMLRSVMRCAGAIRIDHALGLYRLFMIPVGTDAAQGAYVRYPFDAMLAVLAQESTKSHCLVIGEDLGTIPDGVCESLNRWGIWSYRVGLFEREHDGAFRLPEQFPEQAIVTFNTHDLPTFAGWSASHDLELKAALSIDPGETSAERKNAIDALRAMLTHQGLGSELNLINVMRYLARARSQLLSVAIEDILGVVDQPNIPGTTDEHPNWRRRLPVDLEELAGHDTLRRIAEIMAMENRSSRSSDFPVV